MSVKSRGAGHLRIGDDWNAITIIALSQSNPLKAVAEFIENSIDARAKHITITRGREHGVHFLRIKDDGDGIPRDDQGRPDFNYVATHICDSIKRRLKTGGKAGLQGEFGIGLLSFWTLGEELLITSAGSDGRSYQMRLRKGEPSYDITPRHLLLADPGTELVVKNILPGIKQFSGEKIQWYLASELRDRIRLSGVEIRIIDRTARAEYKVEPRQFEGRLLHHLRQAVHAPDDLYLELYLIEPAPENRVGLYRRGTRVLENLADLDPLNKPPWTTGYLQGVIDASYVNLTPGTRLGVIHDATLDRLLTELAPIECELSQLIEAQQRAEEERATHDVLRTIQNALKEALLALPAEEYDWFNLRSSQRQHKKPLSAETAANQEDQALTVHEGPSTEPPAPNETNSQMQFFEHPGPLFSVRISPASTVVAVNAMKNFQAIPRDRSRRLVEENVAFQWKILEGEGRMEKDTGEMTRLVAPNEPGLVRLEVAAQQDAISCRAEALVTVTDSLLPETASRGTTTKGIPGYTFQKAPGQLWRSRFDSVQNVIVINNGHRDFVFASRHKTLKLRYICRLYAKELVLKNFTGMPSDQLLERMIELTLYIEENLK